MSYTTYRPSSQSRRRTVRQVAALGQAMSPADAAAFMAQANAQANAAAVAQANAPHITAAGGALAFGLLALFFAGSYTANVVAKRVAGIDGSVWDATGKQWATYTALSLSFYGLGLLVMNESGAGAAVVNLISPPNTPH